MRLRLFLAGMELAIFFLESLTYMEWKNEIKKEMSMLVFEIKIKMVKKRIFPQFLSPQKRLCGRIFKKKIFFVITE